MNTYYINISDILHLKINAPVEMINYLKRRFPVTIESSDSNDYEITYKQSPIIDTNNDGELIQPFRNSKYFVYKDNGKVVAYSPKHQYSCEHLLVRDDKKINVYANDDTDGKVLIRLVSELLIRKLLERKFFPIHASCATIGNDGIVFLGKKNSGKSVALFSSVVFDKAQPLSNDITFVGKENNKWVGVGIPYDYTFDRTLFSQVGMDLEKYDQGRRFDSDKIRLDVSDFNSIFNTTWIWKANIESANIVDLSKNSKFELIPDVDASEVFSYLLANGKDNNFNFGDYLAINNRYPNYQYELISRDIPFDRMTGNVIEHKLLQRR